MMCKSFGRLLLVCAGWLLVAAPVTAQDETEDVPDSIDTVYVDSIDPYSIAPGELLAFDYEEYGRQARLAYQAGDYEKAARYFIALLRRNIDDSGALYDLACCYGLLEYPMMAGFALEAAFGAGYDDYDWASWDPDFESVREDPAFQESWERIGEAIEERHAGVGEEILVESPVLLSCRVQLPPDYDPEVEYPLLIGLHGYGDNPDNFIGLLERRDIDSSGFIYAAPQGPYPYLPGKQIGYSWIEGAEDDEESWLAAREMSEQYILEVTGELQEHYRISDVYLMGFSQGCVMTYNVGLSYPWMFDGLICFAGWLENDHFTDDWLYKTNYVPVFIAQGLSDTLVEPEESYNARDTLVEHGFAVELFEFDGGHAVPEEALRAALEWIGL